MPHVQVSGTDLYYALVAYDAQGVERSDDPDGPMSQQVLVSLSDDSIIPFRQGRGGYFQPIIAPPEVAHAVWSAALS
jgi:hypothetical protein